MIVLAVSDIFNFFMLHYCPVIEHIDKIQLTAKTFLFPLKICRNYAGKSLPGFPRQEKASPIFAVGLPIFFSDEPPAFLFFSDEL